MLRRCSGRCTRTSRWTPPTGCRRRRRARLPGPRRGGVHQGPAAPDDRPAGAGIELLARRRADPTWPRLLDVVLGHGAHADPRRSWHRCAPSSRRRRAAGRRLRARHRARPSGLRRQRAGLRAGGLPGHRDRGPGRRWPPPRCATRDPSLATRAAVTGRRADHLLDETARWGGAHAAPGRGAAPQGVDVTVVALGDPATGLFRPVGVPHTVVARPDHGGSTLEERVSAAIDTLTAGLADLAGEFDLLHAQDCIAARAAARVRDAGAASPVMRTVHHVDDFTTQALIDCQRLAIQEPDRVLVVSRQWRRILRDEYGLDGRRGTQRRRPWTASRRRPGRSAPSCATGSASALALSCSWPSAASSRARAPCTPSAR